MCFQQEASGQKQHAGTFFFAHPQKMRKLRAETQERKHQKTFRRRILSKHHESKIWIPYCALAPTLAAMCELKCIQLKTAKRTAGNAIFLKMGKRRRHFPHSRAFRLWVWLIHKRETGETCCMLVVNAVNLNQDTCPILQGHLSNV